MIESIRAYGPNGYELAFVNQKCDHTKSNGNNLAFFDNIYYQRLVNNDPKAGQNRNRVAVPKELKPKTSYGYFVEITDANVGGEANYCIFQEHQFFKTL